MTPRSRSLARAALPAALACCALARADSLPTVPGVVHLDPFVAGWLPLGAPRNVVVPPGGASAQPGIDGLTSPRLWVWENELDFVGLIGPISVSLGGMPPVVVTFGPGPDIYIRVDQVDTPAELGPFAKSLTNSPAGNVSVAWGVSVVEDPSHGPTQPGGTFSWNVPGGTNSLPLPPLPDLEKLYIWRGVGVWNITFAPPPAPCPGDANGDRRVDFADLNVVLSQFGQVGPMLSGDLNGDGRVDFADLNQVLSNFGANC